MFITNCILAERIILKVPWLQLESPTCQGYHSNMAYVVVVIFAGHAKYRLAKINRMQYLSF